MRRCALWLETIIPNAYFQILLYFQIHTQNLQINNCDNALPSVIAAL